MSFIISSTRNWCYVKCFPELYKPLWQIIEAEEGVMGTPGIVAKLDRSMGNLRTCYLRLASGVVAVWD